MLLKQSSFPNYPQIEYYVHYINNTLEFIFTNGYLPIEQKLPNEYAFNIDDIEAFLAALFCCRDCYKYSIFNSKNENSFEKFTYLYVVVNNLFFLLLNNKPSKDSFNSNVKNIDEECTIIDLIQIIFTELEKDNNGRLSDEEANSYYTDQLNNSFTNGDLHSYEVQNITLSKFLKGVYSPFNIIETAIQKNKQLNNSYFKGENSLENILYNVDYYHMNEGVYIVNCSDINNVEKEFIAFALSFESKNSKNYNNSNNQLIFSYKTDSHLFISSNVMNITTEMIKKFICWGNYDSLLKDYNLIVETNKNKNKYNRYLTYKIADFLVSNNYILPVQTNCPSIPQIEIKTLKNVDGVDYGDIDILFFSPFSSTLYIMEYKNYEMAVGNNGTIDKDINKATGNDVLKKVTERIVIIRSNIERLISSLKINVSVNDIKQTKSILLTSKPNAYFYLEPIRQSMECYNWKEFEYKIKNHNL